MSTTFDAYLEFTCADPATQSELWDERIRAIQKYAPLCFDPKLKPVYAQTMSTYDTHLSEVFDQVIQLDKATAKKVVSYLMEQGTSFAVTQDKPYRIWLSKVSAKLLVEKNWSTL